MGNEIILKVMCPLKIKIYYFNLILMYNDNVSNKCVCVSINKCVY